MAQASLLPTEDDLVIIALAAERGITNIEGGFKANLNEIFNEKVKPEKDQLEHLKSEIKRSEARIKSIQARIKMDLRPKITITNDKINKIHRDEERILNIVRTTSPRERKKMFYPTKTITSGNNQSTSTEIATSSSTSSSSTSTSTSTPNALEKFNKKHYDQEKKENSRKRKVVTIF